MKMYRIDGKYIFDDKCYNFEVQIKSLVIYSGVKLNIKLFIKIITILLQIVSIRIL